MLSGKKQFREKFIVLVICMHEIASVMSDSLRLCEWLPARLLCPRDSLGKNTGVGCHSFLQGIFLNQGLNLGLPHCRQILYHLSHEGRQSLLYSPIHNRAGNFRTTFPRSP